MDPSLYADLRWLPRPPADFNGRCRWASQNPEKPGSLTGTPAASGLNENQLIRLARQ